MNRIYKIILYPLEDISGIALSQIAREYFKEGKITLNNDMVNTNSSITIIAYKNKDNNTYTEISTGRVIDPVLTNQSGYLCVAASNFDSSDVVSFNEKVINFLTECRISQRKLYSKIQNYINEVYDCQKEIEDYFKEVFNTSSYYVFNFVNVYNFNTNRFDRILLPLEDYELYLRAERHNSFYYYVERDIRPFTHKYIDLISGHKIDVSYNSDMAVYADYNRELCLSDFAILSGIYDIIKYPDELKAKIDSSIVEEKKRKRYSK